MICTEVKANPEHIFQTDKMKIKTMLGWELNRVT